MNRFACPVVATLLFVTAWVAPATVQPPISEHAAAARARHEAAWQKQRARAQSAAQHGAPGRAVLLLSPFGPPPPQDAPAPTISRAEAAQLDADHDGDVVHLAAGCCSPDDPAIARGLVHGLFAARDLPPDAPVLIEADTPFAYRLARRLGDDGLTRVLIVATP